MSLEPPYGDLPEGSWWPRRQEWVRAEGWVIRHHPLKTNQVRGMWVAATSSLPVLAFTPVPQPEDTPGMAPWFPVLSASAKSIGSQGTGMR